MEMKNQIDNHAGQKLISRDDKSSENHLGEKGGLDLRVLIENADSIKAQSSAEKHGDMRISPEKNFNIVIDHSSGADDKRCLEDFYYETVGIHLGLSPVHHTGWSVILCIQSYYESPGKRLCETDAKNAGPNILRRRLCNDYMKLYLLLQKHLFIIFFHFLHFHSANLAWQTK